MDLSYVLHTLEVMEGHCAIRYVESNFVKSRLLPVKSLVITNSSNFNRNVHLFLSACALRSIHKFRSFSSRFV